MKQVRIYKQSKNGLSTVSAQALIRENQTVKLVEIVRPDGENLMNYLEDHADALWQIAVEVNLAWWVASIQRQHRDYFFAIISAVDLQREVGGTLDTALAAGLQAVSANSTKQAEFNQYRAMLSLNTADNVSDKRDLLNAIVTWAMAGVIGGGL